MITINYILRGIKNSIITFFKWNQFSFLRLVFWFLLSWIVVNNPSFFERMGISEDGSKIMAGVSWLIIVFIFIWDFLSPYALSWGLLKEALVAFFKGELNKKGK